MLAHVVVAKLDHHLPLYRQAEMMAAQGIDIDHSTLAGWVGQTSVLLNPIVSPIREVGLAADLRAPGGVRNLKREPTDRYQQGTRGKLPFPDY
jgi:hypothetical protein